ATPAGRWRRGIAISEPLPSYPILAAASHSPLQQLRTAHARVSHPGRGGSAGSVDAIASAGHTGCEYVRPALARMCPGARRVLALGRVLVLLRVTLGGLWVDGERRGWRGRCGRRRRPRFAGGKEPDGAGDQDEKRV